MRYSSFAQFYPYYLGEHARPATRRLHFVGTALVLCCLVALALTGNLLWLIAMPFAGYGFAWLSHVAFEKNRPATFTHPVYSLMGDWKMFWDMLTGKIAF